MRVSVTVVVALHALRRGGCDRGCDRRCLIGV